MESLRKLKSLNGNKKFLLTQFNFKSIIDAKKQMNLGNSNKRLYNLLLNNYNEVIDQIKEGILEKKNFEMEQTALKKQSKKRQLSEEHKELLKENTKKARTNKKSNKMMNQDLENDFLGSFQQAEKIKSKVTISSSHFKQFKKCNTEVKLSYNEYSDENHPENGFETLTILNSAIPVLMKGLNDTKGMKVNITFGLIFSKANPNAPDIKTYFEFPHISKPEIITHQAEIKEFIDQMMDFIKIKIPEIELGNGSSWHFEYVKYIDVHIAKYNPIKIGSYIELSKELKNKKCCINIKNEDDKCIKYCIQHHHHPDASKVHPERVKQYAQFDSEYDWDKINFPVAINNIDKVEELVGCAINVFTEEKIPVRISKYVVDDDRKIINLLVIGENVEGAKNHHYVYIKKFSIFATNNKKPSLDANNNQVDAKGKILLEGDKKYQAPQFFCERCLHPFSSKLRVEKHKTDGCDFFEPTQIQMPVIDSETQKIPEIEFKHFERKFKAPVVIYADFETLVVKSDSAKHDETKSSTSKLAELPPCGFRFLALSQYPQLNLGMKFGRGEDIVDRFLDELLIMGDVIRAELDEEVSMIITPEQEKEFKNCQICHICERKIEDSKTKVRDHDHLNGLYRGCAHQSCNLKLNHKNYKIPVYFHNLKGFDGHLIIQALARKNFSKIDIIAQNFEKYMTFSFGNFRFLDSFAFLASSLDTLSSNLLKDGRQNFKITLDSIEDETQKQLILKKGVYPYEYVDSFSKFDETSLPPMEAFYSQLSESGISFNDYNHAKNVWKAFKINTLGEYHDLYLKIDVMLLADVFEAFRTTAIKNYGLDPANGYFTLPNYAWDAMLLKTSVKLEQLTDVDMYLFNEKGIRGGVSMISHRHAVANNKYFERV